MDTTILLSYAAQNPMASLDKLIHLYHLLTQVLVFQVEGAIVEIGCHEGLTSALFRQIIDYYDEPRELHVYDSFQGLPIPGPFDRTFSQGDSRTNVEALQKVFADRHLKLPIVHSGWFDETLPGELPEPIAFAYLDSNFYSSILTSLKYVYPRLSPGGIICIDDYSDPARNPRAWNGLPGVRVATDEFLSDKPEDVFVLVGTDDLAMCYIRKAFLRVDTDAI